MIHFGLIHPTELEPEEYVMLQESVKLDHTGIQLDDILKMVLGDLARLWRGVDTQGGHLIMVTQVIDVPSGRQLLVWHMAGNGQNPFRMGKAVQGKLEAYAKAIGAKRVVAEPTPATLKLMEMLGYEVTHYRMEKQV